MSTVKIDVTQEDIDSGVQCSTMRCPIAIALQRATGNDNVSVGAQFAVIHQDGEDEIVDLPSQAVEFISRYDSGKYANVTKPEPFSFTLELGDA